MIAAESVLNIADAWLVYDHETQKVVKQEGIFEFVTLCAPESMPVTTKNMLGRIKNILGHNRFRRLSVLAKTKGKVKEQLPILHDRSIIVSVVQCQAGSSEFLWSFIDLGKTAPYSLATSCFAKRKLSANTPMVCSLSSVPGLFVAIIDDDGAAKYVNSEAHQFLEDGSLRFTETGLTQFANAMATAPTREQDIDHVETTYVELINRKGIKKGFDVSVYNNEANHYLIVGYNGQRRHDAEATATQLSLLLSEAHRVAKIGALQYEIKHGAFLTKSAADILGVTRLSFDSILDCLPPEAARLIEEFSNKTPEAAIDIEFVTPDERWVRLSARATYNLGFLTSLIGAVRDITEDREITNRLLRGLNYQHQLLNSLSAGVVVFDRNLLVTEYNTAATLFLPNKDIKNTSIQNVFDQFESEFGAPISTEEIQQKADTVTFVAKTKSESPESDAWYSVTVSPKLAPDQSRIVSFANINPVIEAQTQIRKMNADLEVLVQDRTRALHEAHDQTRTVLKDLAAALSVKTKFFHAVSHDIKTPLNAIVAYFDKEPSVLQTEFGLKTKSAVNHLADLVENLAVVAKIDGDALIPSLTPINVFDIIGWSKGVCQPAAAEKGISIKIESEERSELSVHSDAFFVKRILVNFISNAIKFSPADTNITITYSTLPIKQDNAVMLRISVCDQGKGVSKESQKKLFAAFYSESGNLFTSTGLGLHVSRALARSLHGDCSYADNETGGACFSLELPCELAEDSAVSVAIPSQQHTTPIRNRLFAGKRILSVDDSKLNLEVMEWYLRDTGAEVTSLTNGHDAIEIAEQGQFDLILMDIQMPEISGFAVAEQLRQKGVKTPILAVTAASATDVRGQIRQSGINGLVSKPLNGERLISVISDYLLGAKIVPSVLSATSSSAESRAQTKWEDLFRRVWTGNRIEFDKMMERANPAEVAAKGHLLKGQASQLGWEEIRLAAERLEHAAKGGMTGNELSAECLKLRDIIESKLFEIQH